MIDNTINNNVTLSGEGGTLLVNRYRVLRQLGQGGMGSVWLVEDTKLDGRKVAVKMLPSILVSNKRAYAQVKAEALVSLKLSHPNIVSVRSFEEDNGNPFLVMDYIEGHTLDDYLAEKGKLTEEETICLLKPIAAALDYAHGQGVVHRDVKPGNVMIDQSGHPFVLDFGIAREIQETMTRVTGKLSSGTLMYMSPEQLHGAAPKPSQDVYSFAAMVYECLKGAPPFSRGQIEYQIEHDTPEPLGPQFAKCGPGVMAGLMKSPEERPTTCAKVLSAGVGVLKPKSPNAPLKNEGDGKKPSGKLPLAALMLAVLAIVCVGSWWLGRAGRQETSLTSQIDNKPLSRSEESPQAYKPVPMSMSEKPIPSPRITTPKPGEEREFELVKGVKMKFCWCPPGSFMMGSPSNEEGRSSDETQHKVTLTQGFWMGKYEVTQRQWESVMGANPSYFKGADRPIEQVSWEDCQKFIQKINATGRVTVSLPTEAQWEYACRAGTTTPFSFGSTLNGDKANCDGNYQYGTAAKGRYRQETASVGSYAPNAWGIYDMHGNVWEWCEDWYGSYASEATDPTGPASGSYRVYRGGSWVNIARGCRSALRSWRVPGNRYYYLGFRLVCSPRIVPA